MNDTELYDEAARLVTAMNPIEAKRFYSNDPQHWPEWAKRDFDLAFRSLKRAAGKPGEEPYFIQTPKRMLRTSNGI